LPNARHHDSVKVTSSAEVKVKESAEIRDVGNSYYIDTSMVAAVASRCNSVTQSL
jgi:hypothetical protein